MKFLRHLRPALVITAAARPARASSANRLAGRSGALLLLLYCLCCSFALARGNDCPSPPRAVQPVPAAAAGEVTVATQNLKRLFDDVDDGVGKVLPPVEYRQRLARLARQVDEVLRRPAVLAVQEVEHEKALADLAGALQTRTGIRWRPIAPEGQDSGGIDVGFLVRADWQVLAIEPLLVRQKLDRHPLFDRPPLRLLLRTPQGREIEVINVHLKSLYGSDRNERAARRIARKRQHQAEALAAWVRAALAARPQRRLLVLGDFNATPEVLGGVDVLGILQQAGLRSLLERLPAEERYTFVYRCQPEALDHVLASPALVPAVVRLAVSRGNAGARLRRDTPPDSALASSDHDGLVLYLRP